MITQQAEVIPHFSLTGELMVITISFEIVIMFWLSK